MINMDLIWDSETPKGTPFKHSNYSWFLQKLGEEASDTLVLRTWVEWCRYYRLAPSLEENFADLEEILQGCDNVSAGGPEGILEPSRQNQAARPYGGALSNPAFEATRLALLDGGGPDLKGTVSRWEYQKVVKEVRAFVAAGGKVSCPHLEER